MSSDNLSIFGLGYVGGTAATCFKEMGFNIFGVDLDPNKRQEFRNKIHVVDYQEALDKTDISFICVPTPCQEDGNIDISFVSKVLHQIKDYKPNQMVVLRSTVFPNQISKLEKITKNLVINPEFLREATARQDFFNPPFTIIGARNKKDGEKVLKLYDKIDSKKFITTPEEAQMLKYVSNVWHACKIAFTNEIGSICEEHQIDGDIIMKLFKEDKILNVSELYHRIGEPFGGHCLPKDLSVLQFNSDEEKNPLIHSISKSNEVER